jgi:hypothetical protein
MHRLSHVLAEEIYSEGSAEREAMSEARAWQEDQEQEEEAIKAMEEVLQVVEEEEDREQEEEEMLEAMEEVAELASSEEEQGYYEEATWGPEELAEAEAYPEEKAYTPDEMETYPDDGDWVDMWEPGYYEQEGREKKEAERAEDYRYDE